MTTVKAGASMGKVMSRKTCQRRAPSTSAACLQILRHVLQPGQVEDDRHAVPLPGLHEHDGAHRPVLVGLPLALQGAETDVAQDRIDDADDRIEHQDPDDPRRHRRHDHRQEDDRPVDVGHRASGG